MNKLYHGIIYAPIPQNKIFSQAGGEGGERIKKNVFAGVRGDDYFWKLEILMAHSLNFKQ